MKEGRWSPLASTPVLFYSLALDHFIARYDGEAIRPPSTPVRLNTNYSQEGDEREKNANKKKSTIKWVHY